MSPSTLEPCRRRPARSSSSSSSQNRPAVEAQVLELLRVDEAARTVVLEDEPVAFASPPRASSVLGRRENVADHLEHDGRRTGSVKTSITRPAVARRGDEALGRAHRGGAAGRGTARSCRACGSRARCTARPRACAAGSCCRNSISSAGRSASTWKYDRVKLNRMLTSSSSSSTASTTDASLEIQEGHGQRQRADLAVHATEEERAEAAVEERLRTSIASTRPPPVARSISAAIRAARRACGCSSSARERRARSSTSRHELRQTVSPRVSHERAARSVAGPRIELRDRRTRRRGRPPPS